MNAKKLKRLCIFLAMMLLLGASAKAQTTVFGDAGWDSMKFQNAVAMLIAKEADGMETDGITGSTATTYNALKRGEIHVIT